MEESGLKEAISKLNPRWKLVDGRLRSEYEFKDFAQALDWVNRIGALAERENHHPDLELKWGFVGVVLYTHSIGGLSEKDFALAAMIDRAQTGE